MRILITGINGFVGTNFTNAWKGKHSLFGLDIHQPDKEGVERTFVFFSSVKAAADSVPGEVLTEDIEPNPIGPYGESKIRAEEYLLDKKLVEEVENYIIRRY